MITFAAVYHSRDHVKMVRRPYLIRKETAGESTNEKA